ncbi:hypothetical protein [uncultured Pseudodesulfovibrio sp.]|uniref:hypothetical protein n=1 Tax=uncultured Pseudodesulfovibrio sp. TaxID=2035858 RepID=UPI0029C85987|nr:hypothetical protein [uncultured Pseudodesulfovibrio sp.]
MSETYLEKALVKLARQINAYDEASLMNLWEKYAEKVRHFEPTKRWEENALVFNLIQSIRLKNQLFNYNWAQSRKPGDSAVDIDLAALTAPQRTPSVMEEQETTPETAEQERKKQERKGKLLTLTPKKRN